MVKSQKKIRPMERVPIRRLNGFSYRPMTHLMTGCLQWKMQLIIILEGHELKINKLSSQHKMYCGWYIIVGFWFLPFIEHLLIVEHHWSSVFQKYTHKTQIKAYYNKLHGTSTLWFCYICIFRNYFPNKRKLERSKKAHASPVLENFRK